MVAKKDGSGGNTTLLSDLSNRISSHERATSAAERAVSDDVDTLFVAEVDNLLLGQRGMVLDLVDGGDDLGLGEELLKVSLAVLQQVLAIGVCISGGNATYVADADTLDLASLGELFHLLPGFDVVPVTQDIAGAVRESRELVVIALGVHEDGPMLQFTTLAC